MIFVFFVVMAEQTLADQQLADTQIALTGQHPLSIRIWHWLTFITLTSTIVTVVLASTIYTTKDNTGMVQEMLKNDGTAISSQQARKISHEFSDKLWHLHTYIGFGLAFLLLSRMIIEVAVPTQEKLKNKLLRVLRFRFVSKQQQGDRSHYILVQYGYLFFYFIMLVMALTGLGMAYEDVPFLRSINEPLSEIHQIFQYLMYFYFVVHVTGVILAESGRSPGLVSRMIAKNKTI